MDATLSFYKNRTLLLERGEPGPASLLAQSPDVNVGGRLIDLLYLTFSL